MLASAVAARVGNCPNCGGQVEFKANTSLLSICPYCSSAVARTGGDVGELEILGKVAPLADLGSPLSLGTSGKYRGKPFTVIGRLQLDYGAGPWNEWYASFDDGRWGWVAEAQGRLYVTFGKELSGLPAYESASVGSKVRAGKLSLTVVERRRARFIAAEGELPHAVAPGTVFAYCDLEGPNEVFGTIDYGDRTGPPVLYLGEQVQYQDLFDKSVLRDIAPGQAAGQRALNCPNCGAAVEIRAPDESQRVSCTACDALLDCSPGSDLSIFSSAKHSGPEPEIPVGSKGKLFGHDWTIYGHLTRSVTIEGVRYFWEEYLLRAPARGYRWLTVSEGHWSWVEPVHAGDVESRGNVVRFRGRQFRRFQSASAKVESIRGEFYWKVALGERVSGTDFIDPPNVLSEEVAEDEVTWSLGQYLEPKVIESAFRLKSPLSTPRGVAAHQPNPWAPRLKSSARAGAIFSVVLVSIGLIMAGASGEKIIYERSFPITPKAPTGATAGAAITTDPFNVEGRSNLALKFSSDVLNNRLFLDGSLVNQTSQQIHHFGAQIRTLGGFEGKELGATGGNPSRTVYLGGIEPGSYVLNFSPEWIEAQRPPLAISVEVREDVFLTSHAVTALALLWIFPLLGLIGYYAFEKKRWSESDHG